MHRRCLLTIAIALLGLAGPVAAAPSRVPGELIVKYRPATGKALRASIQSSMGATVEHHFHLIDADLVTLPAGVTVDAAVAALQNNPNVEYAEPNSLIEELRSPDDSLFSQQWDMRNTGQSGGVAGADIGATRAWDLFTGDPNLKIGVIDSGVDYTHPDLVDNIWTNPGEIPDNHIDDDGNGYVDDVHGYDFANNDSDPMDEDGHGTHVAGTIAARGDNHIGVAGVCWRAKIVCIKFLSGGSGFTSNAIAAIEYSVAVGAKITNNSWGGSTNSQALRDAIAAAGDAGQLFVAAAGNAGASDDLNPTYPSAYDLPNIVSVAAINRLDQLSTFSNYGATSVDLGAPGEAVISTLRGGGYVAASGTSMAAPHVTGALALMWGRHPELAAAQLKARLLASVVPIPALAGRTVTGGRLSAVITDDPTDVTPPAAITDLSAPASTSNSITLTWHAPGDDGNTGTAEHYELRYSTSPLTEVNFAAGTLFELAPPGIAGHAESAEVGGLAFAATYYFAVRTFDDAANVGALSNVTSGVTLGAPLAAVTPTAITVALPSGGQATRLLELRNTGAGTLDYSLESGALGNHAAVVEPYAATSFAKGMANPQAAVSTLASHGGPDHYGNRWASSDDAGGPVFSWVEISESGTPLALTGDDATSEAVPIGFSYHFYDGVFNSLRVCSNGWVSFTSSLNNYYYQPLPNGGAPENMIAPYWTDLVLTPGSVFVQRDAGRMIVEFKNAHTYDGAGPYTFEVVLSGDGRALVQYLTMPASALYATVGIQNAQRDDGLTIAFNAAFARSGLAVQVEPPRSWLSVAPRSGRIPAGQSQSIAVGIDASGQFAGTYQDVLRIVSNDPQNPQLSVPVRLDVTGVPIAHLNRSTLDFGTLLLGGTASDSMTVSNPGTEVLAIAGIDVSNPEVTVTPSAFTLGVFESRLVRVSYHPLATGSPGHLTVRSNDPVNAAQTVAQLGVGAPPPLASMTPASLEATLPVGSVVTRALRLSNTGDGPLFFRAQRLPVGATWLAVLPDTGEVAPQATRDLAVRFNASTLLGGIYDGAVRLTTNDPARPVLPDVAVRATVVGVPQLQLSAVAINFGGVFVTHTGLDSVNIVNEGTGPLTVSQLAASPAIFTVNPAPFVLAPGESRALRVSFAPSTEGPVTGALTFNSDDATQLAVSLPLSGTGLPGPDLALDPNSLSATLPLLANQTQDMTLSNLTAHSVIWTATVSLSLDAAPPPTAVAPGWITLAARHDGADLPRIEGPAPHAEALGALVAASNPTVIAYQNNVESGVNGMQATGDLMWHITSRASVSPSHSWWCGDESSVSYSTGSRVRASLVTPLIDLRVMSPPATLTFYENYSTEPGWDECRIDVTYDLGATWTNLRANAWGTTNGWVQTTVDLSAAAGKVCALRFFFDTHDPIANNYPGWFLDNLVVSTTLRDWLDLPLRIGSLEAGAGTVLHPEFRAGNNSAGLYTGSAIFQTSDATHAPLQLPLRMLLTGVPVMGLSSFAVTLPTTFIGATSTDTSLHVVNSGTDWLNLTNIQVSAGAFSTPLVTLQVPPGASRVIPLMFSPTALGTSTGTLSFATSDPNHPAVSVALSGSVPLPPAIAIGSDSIYAETRPAITSTRTLAVSNTGTGPLTWSASLRPAPGVTSVPAWLTIDATQGTLAPGSSFVVTVRVAANLFIAGLYRAVIRFTSNDPTRPVIDFPVTVLQSADAFVVVNQSSLEFGGVHVGQSKSLVFELTSGGTTTVLVQAMTTSPGPFAVLGAIGPLAPGSSVPVIVTYAPLVVGDAVRTLTILTNDPVRPELKIPLHGVATTPAQITVSPLEFLVTTNVGRQVSRQLALGNTGGDALHYQIQVVTTDLFARAPETPPLAARAMGATVAKASAGLGLAARGGPDRYGHAWLDSDEPDGPVYQWIELVGSGTLMQVSGDDVISSPTSIGFTFPFYDSHFTQFTACSNGWISFSALSPAFDSHELPSTGAPENLLSVFWANLVAPAGSMYYRRESGRLIVEWTGLTLHGGGGSFAFEAIIEQSGTVTCQYKTLTNANFVGFAGIQDASRTDGFTIVGTPGYPRAGMAIRINTPAPWVTMNTLAGTIPAGSHVDLPLTFDATGRGQSIHNGHLQIDCDDPNQAQVTVPLHLIIQSEPDIAVTPPVFPDVVLGGSVMAQLQVQNEGDRLLTVSEADLEGDGFEVLPPGFPLLVAPGTSAPVNLRFSPSDACDPCTGSIRLYSDDPDEDQVVMALSARALNPPAIELAPTKLSARLAPAIGVEAEHTGRALAVTNSGGVPLHVTASSPAAWLQVTPATATVAPGATAQLAVTFDAHGLADGLLAGVVRLASDDPGRPIASVPCSLQVGALAAALDARLDRVDHVNAGRWVMSGVTLAGGRDPHQLLGPTLRLMGLPAEPTRAPEYTGLQGRFAFDRLALLALLQDGTAVPLTLTGRLADSTWIDCTGFARIARPAMAASVGPLHAAGESLPLTWTPPALGAPTGYDLWYSSDDLATARLVSAGDPDVEWNWTVPLPRTTNARLELVARDEAGEMGWWISDAFEVTTATTGVDAARPLAFGLRVAGDNPASHAPAVELATPSRMAVRVDVFDVRGRQVRALARGEFAAGRAVLRWDGRDDLGRSVEAGIYFVRAVAGASTSATARWVLLH